MEAFDITTREVDGFPVFRVAGYLNAQAGKELAAKVDTVLDAGHLHPILDLSDCTVLNSPGVGELMTLVFRVNDDFQGRTILFGADQLKLSVMKLTGLLEVMEIALSLEDAVQKARAARHPLP